MGIIARESIKSSFASYFGLIVGIINVIFLSTKFLSPDQLGLTKVLQDSTLILVSLSQFGSPYIVIRFFPNFYNESTHHNGFLFLMISYNILSFVVFTILFISLQGFYLDFYLKNSPLLIQYLWYIIPFVFGTTFINLFESYVLIYNKIFFPNFIREVFLRLSNTIAIIFYATNVINFTNYVQILVASYLIAVLIMIIYTKKINALLLKPSLFAFNFRQLKPIISYGAFTFAGGIGYLFATRIDTVMLPAYKGLTQTAIYSIAVLIATVMEIPKRNIVRSVIPFLTFAIKENDYKKIDDLNKKTSLNLSIFGLLLLLLIIINMNDLFKVIPNGNIYSKGESVLILFLLIKILDFISGVSNEIVLYSKYYNYAFYLIIILAVLTVVTNMIFIPILGILGAAIATGISVLVYLVVKMLIVWKKFDSHPFNRNMLKAFILFLIVGAISFILDFIIQTFSPSSINPLNIKIISVLQILIKSAIITVFFVFMYIKYNVSQEFNDLMSNIYLRIKKILFNFYKG